MALVTFLKKLSLRTRLTVLFVLIFGTTTILFSGFLYYSLNDSLQQDFDNALYNYAVDVSRNIDIGPKNDLLFPPLKVDEGKIFPFPYGTALIQVRHITGKVLIRSGDFGNFKFPYQADTERIKKGEDSSYRTLDNIDDLPQAEAYSYRLITFPLDSVNAPSLFLQIAVPMSTFETQLDRLKLIISFGLPAVLLIAIISGLYFSSRALRPVQEIIEKANRIDASNLAERVPIPIANDQIRKLAETQNQMLDRIQKSFQSQERFVADASHQLLTPLTILRGEIEIQQKTLQKDPHFFDSALQEVDNLAKIVKDMLLLAQIDAGSDLPNFTELEVDEILIDVISRCQKIAVKKEIQIKFEILEKAERPRVHGDADLLSNLFFNIIENAIKYSPQKAEVDVQLIWEATETIIEITDQGPGIAFDQIETIFERFSRVNPSGKTKGFGLGLAIAKKIATLHNSEITIIQNETFKRSHGARFQIKMRNV
ncbi:MAG: HAMP domain-containing protein [Bdellovibrionaceae bacterium]|nr:HAMP domain-containing protein [Bdellovibrio sp.]